MPPDSHADVDVTHQGFVEQNRKGMSVGGHWTVLPGHLIPKRLVSIFPGATGSNALRCFRFGSGPFEPGELTEDLMLHLKATTREQGNVTPGRNMTLDEFQAALASTRADWVVDEDLQ